MPNIIWSSRFFLAERRHWFSGGLQPIRLNPIFLPLLEFEGLAINSRGIKDASRRQTLVRDIQRVATYIVSVIV